MRHWLLPMLLLTLLTPLVFAQTPGVDLTGVLTNPGFEQAGTNNNPLGWSPFISGQGFELSRDDTVAHSGRASARLLGRPGAGDRACYGTMSVPVAAPKYLRLHVWYKGTGSCDGFVRFRPVAGVKVDRDEYGTFAFKLNMPSPQWQELVFDVKTPEAALQAGKVRVETNLYQRSAGTLWLDDVSIEGFEKIVRELKLLEDVDPLAQHRRPADGLVVQQNPPDFSWSPQAEAVAYTLQLSPTADFAAGKTIERQVKYIYYSHPATLAVGTWYWRWRFANADGDQSAWSRTTKFVVTDKAVPFVTPSVSQMRDRVPQTHPRIFTTAAGLAAFRAPLQTTKKEWWEKIYKPLVERLLKEPLAKEPPATWLVGARPGGGPLTDELIALLGKLETHCFHLADRVEQLGFAYLLTGDRRYSDAVIAQLMEISTWDADNGVTSYRNTDRCFRALTFQPALAYDWCYDAMTPEQRTTISRAIAHRGALFIKHFRDGARPLNEYPYDSHAITALNYLVMVSVALVHDEPVATDWFDFLLAVYPAMYPPWGDEDGGWAQGIAYWKWSMADGWWAYDTLKTLTGVDFYQKAHSRNNPWFKFYFQPPWCRSGHFGDSNPGEGVDVTDRANLAHYAAIYKNPYFQWYATVPPAYDRGFYGLCSYWWYDDTVPVRPPADLPQGRLLRDIGWVAMHSDLSDPDDIMFLMKSSPYGSWNHSHADQNHFVVYGYGEPLIIDSGYYDWYGSPHDAGWTRQTKAHNDILVNGQGQPIWDKGANGSITEHFNSTAVDYTCGDATPAYKGALSNFKRQVIYLRPDVFVLYDEVEAPVASEFTWTLHATNQMQIDEAGQQVTISNGLGKCQVQFLTPQALRLTQTDQFTPPPSKGQRNQWHLQATTATKSTRAVFVTLVHPYPAADPAGAVAVRTQTQGDRMTLTWGNGAKLTLWTGPADKRPANMPAFALSAPWQPGRWVAATIKGQTVSQGSRVLLKSTQPCLASVELSGKSAAGASASRVTVQLAAEALVTLPFTQAERGKLRVDGKPLSAEAARGGLTVKLGPGTHVLTTQTPATGPVQATPVTVTLDGRPQKLAMQAMRTFDDGVLCWGTVQTPALPVRVEQVTLPAGSQLSLSRQRPQVGQTIWLTEASPVSLRVGPKAGPVAIALRSIISNPAPLVAGVAPASLESKPGAIKQEAEDFVASSGGVPERYRTREFLSGGVGVAAWRQPGMTLTWKWQVPHAGKYNLLIKGAVYEAQADRWISVDDQGLLGEYRLFRFPNTGGFGAVPEQWKALLLRGDDAQPLTLNLSAGTHTLTMTCLSNLMNLDYLVLVPAD